MLLQAEKDPMGAAITDYFNGDESAEIIVHSNIDEDDSIPAHYLFRSLSQMPEMEKMALIHCSGHVLDVGAAAGTHALTLQELGNKVTAIDISSAAVQVMNKREVADARCIDFFDLTDEKFDTLLLLMNGIGIVGDLLKLDAFLEHAKTLLNKGGQIIFDSADLIDMFTEEDGSVRIDMKKTYYGEVIYQMEYREIKSNLFKWLYIDFDTLKKVASRHGFECEQLHEDASYNAYLSKLTYA